MALAVVDEVLGLKKKIEATELPTPDADPKAKTLEFPTARECLDVLAALNMIAMDKAVLSKTRVGVTVSRLRHHPSEEVAREAKRIVNVWRDGVVNKRPSIASIASDPSSVHAASSAASAAAVSDDSRMEGGVEASSSDAGSRSEYRGPQCGDEKRNKAREVLFKAAMEGLPEDQLRHIDSSQMGVLMARVEEALWAHSGGDRGSPAEKKAYNSQLRSIKSNLADKKNPEFNVRIYLGAHTPESLADMSSVAMASDAKKRERQKTRKDALEACQSDWDLRNLKRAEGQFPCGKCKSSNTSYFQMQTRSSDEPMTTFVHCLDCNNRWRF